MNQNLNYLRSFITSESDPEILENTLVGRKNIVDNLEKFAIESVTSGNKLQQLIIGPRGSGKTHLLKVLHNRLISNDLVMKKGIIAYLCEDEYGVATFLDWNIRVLKSFIRWDSKDSAYLVDELEKLKDAPHLNQEKIAKNLLLNHIQGKTLIIIVENIGNIFNKKKGFGKIGQQKFRDMVQQYPYFSIVASNQALFHEIQKEDMPFNNFFKIIPLKKLTLNDTILFLNKIAEGGNNKEVIRFIKTPEGLGRINAIYDLVGGNHRLLVIFYQFLIGNLIYKLSDAFLDTINDLIPYYQNMMFLLTAQQQKIVQFLCHNRKPSNVKNISDNCYSKENIISKQMSNLVRLHYVDSIKHGKETFYELSEPLLRICYEIEDNHGGPIKLFIDFLGNLYTAEEIKKKYIHYYLLSEIVDKSEQKEYIFEQLYYKETLSNYFKGGDIEKKVNVFERADYNEQLKILMDDLEKDNAYSSIIDFTSKVNKKDRYLLFKEAIAYGKIGKFKKEIKIAKSILSLDNKDQDALLLIGDALLKEGNYLESIKYYKKLLILDKNKAIVLANIGVCYLFLKQLDNSEKFVTKSLGLEPNRSKTIYLIGLIKAEQGDHKKAKRYFERYVELEPDDADTWAFLGEEQINLEEIKEAQSSFERSLALDDKLSSAIFNLGQLFGDQGDHKKAVEYYQRFVELEPDDADGWTSLGAEQFLLGLELDDLEEIKEAQSSFERSLTIDDNQVIAIFSLGFLYDDQGDHKKALEFFERFVELEPDDADVWAFLGKAQLNLGMNKEAQSSFERSLTIDDNQVIAIFSLGTIFGNQGDHKKALEFFERFIELEPDDTDGWTFLGNAQFNLKKNKKALSSYLTALKISPNNIRTLIYIAEVYMVRKDFKNTNKYIDKALSINSNDSVLLNEIGEILRKINKVSEAIVTYKKAIKAEPNQIFPYFNVVTCYLVLNKINLAIINLEKGINIVRKSKEHEELILSIEENLYYLFSHTITNEIPLFFKKLQELMIRNGLTEYLIKSFPGAIFRLLNNYNAIGTDRFEYLIKYFKEEEKNHEDLTIPNKFLKVGFKHLVKKDKKSLMNLTKEERATYNKFVIDRLDVTL